jgi:hypothetical protein
MINLIQIKNWQQEANNIVVNIVQISGEYFTENITFAAFPFSEVLKDKFLCLVYKTNIITRYLEEQVNYKYPWHFSRQEN